LKPPVGVLQRDRHAWGGLRPACCRRSTMGGFRGVPILTAWRRKDGLAVLLWIYWDAIELIQDYIQYRFGIWLR
jgi:hypothetical protein